LDTGEPGGLFVVESLKRRICATTPQITMRVFARSCPEFELLL